MSSEEVVEVDAQDLIEVSLAIKPVSSRTCQFQAVA